MCLTRHFYIIAFIRGYVLGRICDDLLLGKEMLYHGWDFLFKACSKDSQAIASQSSDVILVANQDQFKYEKAANFLD